MKKFQTRQERIEEVREWFGRHKNDYCHHDLESPPKVWAEYMAFLLSVVTEEKQSASGIGPFAEAALAAALAPKSEEK